MSADLPSHKGSKVGKGVWFPWRNQTCLSDAQDTAELLLYAEARFGELLESNPSIKGRIGGGREKTLPSGVSHKRSHEAQALHRNREAIALDF